MQQKCDAISSVTLDKVIDSEPKQYWFRMQSISPANKKRLREERIGAFGEDYNTNFRTQRQNDSNGIFTRPRKPSVLE